MVHLLGLSLGVNSPSELVETIATQDLGDHFTIVGPQQAIKKGLADPSAGNADLLEVLEDETVLAP